MSPKICVVIANYYPEISDKLIVDKGSEGKGTSNSFTSTLARFGIPVSCFLFFCFFSQKIITKKIFLFTIILIISLFSQPLIEKPFFLIFLVSGFYVLFSKFIDKRKT